MNDAFFFLSYEKTINCIDCKFCIAETCYFSGEAINETMKPDWCPIIDDVKSKIIRKGDKKPCQIF